MESDREDDEDLPIHSPASIAADLRFMAKRMHGDGNPFREGSKEEHILHRAARALDALAAEYARGVEDATKCCDPFITTARGDLSDFVVGQSTAAEQIKFAIRALAPGGNH